MEHEPIRIMVVDDDERLTSAWERLLAKYPDLTLVCTLHRAESLASAISSHNPNVVLLDLVIPGDDTLGSMSRALSERPQTRVLIYSGHNDENTECEVARAGARGLVDKLEEPSEILKALRKIASGQVWFKSLRAQSISLGRA